MQCVIEQRDISNCVDRKYEIYFEHTVSPLGYDTQWQYMIICRIVYCGGVYY